MKSVLIFSGNNDRAIIAFCRYAMLNNISFSIVTNGGNDLIFNTAFKRNVICTREFNKLSIENILFYVENIRKNSGVDTVFILPSTEYLNRFLINHKTALEQNNIDTGLCGKKLYELISDKYSFSEKCKDFKIDVPKEFDEFPKAYPYIIKPKLYKTTESKIDKPTIITSKKDLKKYWKDKDLKDYYLQEYVEGKSIYLLYYFSKDGNYDVFSQENLIQQYNGGSMVLCKSSNYHLETISEKFGELFTSLNFSGLVMVEVKLHNNKFVMIEANPRLWGPSQLILDAEMNLFDSFALDNELLKNVKKRNYKKDVWYFWSGGIVDTLYNKQELTYYNFKKKYFITNYQEILKNEIFLKPDTLNIYLKQNKLNEQEREIN
ncbi:MULTISPECIES: ATP-grasp domain-containing protein [Flavobacteriaceae]|uniref:ATP-grasp domain-containing protein n=2 Tax=Flavobacteriaceae TaxID=49546 RepID=A0A4Y8AV33_9FLAO|nr:MULTISPECIES: ATP-grasp domain-containing protein [Flavobacteriaceae]TEW75230.1 ATP-grasp domain-containing protein [Gramella jeungdoensis]GGK60389.1 hypothetical protein GCM10007963_30600 [Lutibacter litoralis]